MRFLTLLFFFFKTYAQRKATARFKYVIEYMEDIEQRDKVLEIFNKWKKTKAVKAYWAFRDKENQDDHHNIESLSPSVISSHSTISLPNSNSSRPADSTTATTAITDSTTSFKTIETTETISLSEAKDLIAPNIELCDNTTIDPQDIPQTLSRSKRYVFDLLNTSLLTFETHLQHLRSLSNVLLIGKHAYHLDLDKHSICDISDIRQSLYDTSGFNKQQSKFPKEIMIKVITIVNSINCESMTRIIGATKVGELVNRSLKKTMTNIMKIQL
ncbi:hypothetical protein J3Q64DRAFT_1718175 [Phycomyces blakesleeanus]|uniref:Uncharacterized protein n=1 Tax=Phycomyces blakesleeanus TaxID=4837 RepID=A0ABR3B8C4_PHYBL